MFYGLWTADVDAYHAALEAAQATAGVNDLLAFASTTVAAAQQEGRASFADALLVPPHGSDLREWQHELGGPAEDDEANVLRLYAVGMTPWMTPLRMDGSTALSNAPDWLPAELARSGISAPGEAVMGLPLSTLAAQVLAIDTHERSAVGGWLAPSAVAEFSQVLSDRRSVVLELSPSLRDRPIGVDPDDWCGPAINSFIDAYAEAVDAGLYLRLFREW